MRICKYKLFFQGTQKGQGLFNLLKNPHDAITCDELMSALYQKIDCSDTHVFSLYIQNLYALGTA